MSIKNLILNFSLINSEIMGKLICNYEISKENKTSRRYVSLWQMATKGNMPRYNWNTAKVGIKHVHQSIHKRQRKVNAIEKEKSC